jgi:hypothetical protein
MSGQSKDENVNNMQNKSTILDVVEDPLTGDLILQLTDELCNELGWTVGDTLVWEELPNNSWSVRKKDNALDEKEKDSS